MFALIGLGDLGILPHHNGVMEEPSCHHTEATVSEVPLYRGHCIRSAIIPRSLYPKYYHTEIIVSEVPSYRDHCNSYVLDWRVASVKSSRHKYPRYVRSDQTRRSRYIPCHFWVWYDRGVIIFRQPFLLFITNVRNVSPRYVKIRIQCPRG